MTTKRKPKAKTKAKSKAKSVKTKSKVKTSEAIAPEMGLVRALADQHRHGHKVTAKFGVTGHVYTSGKSLVGVLFLTATAGLRRAMRMYLDLVIETDSKGNRTVIKNRYGESA